MPDWRRGAEAVRELAEKEHQQQEASMSFQITARIRGDDPVANQHTIDQLITTVEQLYDLVDSRCNMDDRIATCRYHASCREMGRQRKIIMDRLIDKLDAWEKHRERVA